MIIKRFLRLLGVVTLDELKAVQAKLDDLQSAAFDTQKRVEASDEETRAEYFQTKSELYDLVWLASIGADVSETEMVRYVPLRVYFDDPVPDYKVREQIISEFESFAASAGFVTAFRLPAETGSWYEELWMKTKGLFKHKDVQERVAKLEEAAELQLIEKPKAEISSVEAKTVATLLESVKDQDRCYIDFGELLIVKYDGKIFVRRLTPDQVRLLEENRSTWKDVERIIDMLIGGPDADNPKLPPTKK